MKIGEILSAVPATNVMKRALGERLRAKTTAAAIRVTTISADKT
jgi:hypothetical protein